MQMISPDNLRHRLHLLEITEITKQNISPLHTLFMEESDELVKNFYGHLKKFPEARKILAGVDIPRVLYPKQKSHWNKLLSCTLDENFVKNAVHIGQIHFRCNVAPYIYMAGYNYFHCELIALASEKLGSSYTLGGTLMALTRLITLDMDLALSAYTREFWKLAAPETAA
jgi:hypothetical protein